MTEVRIQTVDVPGLATCTVAPYEWEVLSSCPLCNRSKTTVLSKVQEGPELSVCYKCQFGFLSRRPTKEWIDSFYASKWDQKGQQVIPNVPIDLRAYNMVKDVLLKESRVLEVGAGWGGMLLPFRDAGHSIAAVEPSGHRAENLVGQGVEVFKDIPTDGDWDLVVMHHALEHVYDPDKTVRDISKALRTGGMFLVLVPYFHQEHPIQASHYVPHLSLFTAYSLTKLLSQNGLYPVVAPGIELVCIAEKGEGGVGIEWEEDEFGERKDGQFEERTREWVLRSLASGAITVAWTIENDEVVRYPGITMVGHLDARSMFQVNQDHLRTLWLDCPEKPELPITYIHENTDTVWVK